MNAFLEKGSRPISRVLSWATIHLGRASPRASSDLPGSPREPRVRALGPARFPIWPCSRWGFPCRRVLPPTRCALTAPFHPCLPTVRRHRRSALCCTFRGLAPPRRYLAPCSVEPGLSSATNRSGCLADSRAQYTARPGGDGVATRAVARARAPGRRVPCVAGPWHAPRSSPPAPPAVPPATHATGRPRPRRLQRPAPSILR